MYVAHAVESSHQLLNYIYAKEHYGHDGHEWKSPTDWIPERGVWNET
jgi:hypothetical protein